MTEPENFLQRWSKRKLGKDEPDVSEQVPARESAKDASPQTARTEQTTPPQEHSFDVASLPSIESIGADTDIRMFLRPGVPPELTRAALRRAWSADPAIRDFVGLVENGWDFNDPEAMAGFGPIAPADVARLVSQALGEVKDKQDGRADGAGEAAVSHADGGANSPIEPLPEPNPESLREEHSLPKSSVDSNRSDVQRSEYDAPQYRNSDG
jgi:hypothetical protein